MDAVLRRDWSDTVCHNDRHDRQWAGLTERRDDARRWLEKRRTVELVDEGLKSNKSRVESQHFRRHWPLDIF